MCSAILGAKNFDANGTDPELYCPRAPTYALKAKEETKTCLHEIDNSHKMANSPCVQCNNKFPVLLKGIIAINFFGDGSSRVNGLCEYKALMDGQCMYNFSVWEIYSYIVSLLMNCLIRVNNVFEHKFPCVMNWEFLLLSA